MLDQNMEMERKKQTNEAKEEFVEGEKVLH
jgi:hypothetical protein